MDPYGLALKEFHAGVRDQPFFIRNIGAHGSAREQDADGQRALVRLERLFSLGDATELEKVALAACRGRVLDVGAGAGRHSLLLRERGFSPIAIDINRTAVEIMRERGVPHAECRDVLSYRGELFDTVLLLWHGLGIAGTLAGLRQLLCTTASLLAPNGQILAESVEPQSISSLDTRDEAERRSPLGHVSLCYRFEYRDLEGAPFFWLNVSFAVLCTVAASIGMNCERLATNESGEYLCRLTRAARFAESESRDV